MLLAASGRPLGRGGAPAGAACPSLVAMQAPGWVSYVALVLSAASLGVAFLAYRAGGPRLTLRSRQLRPSEAGNPFPDGTAFALTVVNAGRAAVTVEGLHVMPFGSRKHLLTIDGVDGPQIPFRLEAHASETWTVDALPAARRLDVPASRDSLVPGVDFQFCATAGDGKVARDHRSHRNLRVIADAGAHREQGSADRRSP